MRFRARLLASFVAISLLVTFIFGVTAYRVADHSALERETSLFQRLIAQQAASLAHIHGSGLERLQASVVPTKNDARLLLLATGGGSLVKQSAALAIEPRILATMDRQLERGITAGSMRRGDHTIVWAVAPIEGLPYRLVGVYRPASVIVSPLKTLGIRLAVAGLITIWITIWSGLILTGGLMKRLDKQNEALLHQALYDGLTELPNRRLLFDRLQQAISLSRRIDTAVALLVIDLDDFKAINDALGHHSGDSLLKHVASQLRQAFRGSDTVARLGSDEFALVLPETPLRQAIACAGKAIAALEAPLVFNGIDIRAAPSIGITVYPDHGDNPEDLLRRADIAMHKAKQEKSRYAVYESDADLHTLDRLSLISELRNALDSGGLRPYYQPKIRLSDNSVIGVETLLRWQHPVRGFVPPDQFIPLAERTGLITALTPWVLEEALKQVAAWKQAGMDFPVAINMSVRNLHDRNLPDQITRLLHAWEIDAGRVTLEITESAMMVDPERALKMLKALAGVGLKLSIDDFGTGYSSLAYLQQLPVSEIKIDKSFVLGMGKQDRARAIVQATIDLAHTLGLQVVAEGVEDAVAEESLRSFGCDFAQGYHIARPLPPAELCIWFHGHVPPRIASRA